MCKGCQISYLASGLPLPTAAAQMVKWCRLQIVMVYMARSRIGHGLATSGHLMSSTTSVDTNQSRLRFAQTTLTQMMRSLVTVVVTCGRRLPLFGVSRQHHWAHHVQLVIQSVVQTVFSGVPEMSVARMVLHALQQMAVSLSVQPPRQQIAPRRVSWFKLNHDLKARLQFLCVMFRLRCFFLQLGA